MISKITESKKTPSDLSHSLESFKGFAFRIASAFSWFFRHLETFLLGKNYEQVRATFFIIFLLSAQFGNRSQQSLFFMVGIV